ncbi:hypothetical protein [Runella sp.]|uniref:hypothetical protein n=1 Tax=Runella sp. TaxID=1960881 RepID=UPI003D0A7910
MVHGGLDWLFGNLVLVYYPIGFFLLLFTCLASGIIPGYIVKISGKTHFALLALMIVFLRIPSIGFNQELNPDESQMLTQALTLSQKPIFWESVDGTTSGPLNSYVLLLLSFFGIPLDYTAARIIGLGLILIAFYFFYRSLQLISQPVVTRLSALAIAVFFAWTTWSDFLYYSGELTGLPLLTACFYIATLWITDTKRSFIHLFIMGFMAGLVPFGKLQALPVIAGPLVILALYLTQSPAPNYRALSVLVLGGVSSVLIILLLCVRYNVLDDFYTYYLLANLIGYEELTRHSTMLSLSSWERLLDLPGYLAHNLDILSLIALIVIVLLMQFFKVTPEVKKHRGYQWTIAMTLVTLGLSLFAVFKPETQFSHYLLFVVFPFGWALALCLSAVLRENHAVANRWPIRVFVSAMLFFILLRFVLYGYFNSYSAALNTYPPMSDFKMHTDKSVSFNINPYLTLFPRYIHLQKSPVSIWIEQTTKPTDCIAVWGWNCRFYVESQRRQGVAESVTQRSIMKNSFQAVYLEKYLRNLEENQPLLFLDAVGPKSFMFTLETQRHEYFPALNTFIASRYSFVKEIEHIRIYKRKANYPSLLPASQKVIPETSQL